MLYIYNYLALYIDNNNVNNMAFVGSYCLFLAQKVEFYYLGQK